MKKDKKVNRRSAAKYPALEPRFNLKTRTDLIDYDYIDKLSEKDKAWLNAFTEEFLNANMKHKGKKLHKTKKLKRECYASNNARNRDILTRSKACGKALSLQDVTESDNEKNNPMDDLIEKIDNSKLKPE